MKDVKLIHLRIKIEVAKKTLIVTLFIIVLFFCFSGTNIAKEKKATSQAFSKKQADILTIEPFDITVEKLPPNYKGTDIAKLFTSLAKKAPIKKGEFETSEDYSKKIKAVLTDNIYAFKVDADDLLTVSMHPYDADAQMLEIDIKTTWVSEHTFVDYRASMILKSKRTGFKTYIGSNAFGATTVVKRFEGTQYGIALVNQNEFGSSNYDNQYNIATPLTGVRKIKLGINIPPNKAKTLKNKIGILLLCKPSLFKSSALVDDNPLIFERFYYKEPTIDYPEEHSFTRKYINVEVIAIWLYDIHTGKIILKKQLRGIHSKDEK